MYKKFLKRAIDIIVSFFGLLILLPVLIMISVLVKIKLGSPIIFKQSRPGKNGKIFMMYKFRTMSNEKNENGDLLPDAKRLTKFGKKLRNSSLDELPEIWNVLRGDMSLVGPRPLLVEYLELYTAEESKRHCIKPGLTGLAQISGRNGIAWKEKFSYDLVYIERYGFFYDIKILLQTFWIVLAKTGVKSEGSVTSKKYKG